MSDSWPFRNFVQPLQISVGSALITGPAIWAAQGAGYGFADPFVIGALMGALVSGACFAVFLRALFGRTGLIAGGLVGGGGWITVLIVLWSGISYDEIFLEQWRELRELARPLCDGTGSPIANALDANTKETLKGGYLPTLVLEKDRYNTYDIMGAATESALYTDIQPDHSSVATVAIVACIDRPRTVLASCSYVDLDGGGGTVERVREDTRIRLLSLKTGQIVEETTMTGGIPGACPETAEFYGENSTKQRPGSRASKEEISAFIKQAVTKVEQ